MMRVMSTTRITLFGIPNCDSVKKARVWMQDHQVEHEFHDFKKQGVPEAALDIWLDQAGWETLVNRKGTTWRQLDAATQAAVTDRASARRQLLATPSLIKRPVVMRGRQVVVGVNPDGWQAVKEG
jgi:Spx/MgsR family transcriptional regulator